jgi:hypothetical protein
MLLDNPEGCLDPLPGQSVVLRQLQARAQPELCFTAGVLDMHVRPRLFAGKEVPVYSQRDNKTAVDGDRQGQDDLILSAAILAAGRLDPECRPASHRTAG